LRGAIEKQLLQNDAADAESGTPREARSGDGRAIAKLKSCKWETEARIESDAQPGESGDAVGQQPFAASLINRGTLRIGNRDAKSPERCSDGSGEPGRSATHDKYVSLRAHRGSNSCRELHGAPILRPRHATHDAQDYQRRSTNSEQKPGPIAAKML
jgi:hypothetical protein